MSRRKISQEHSLDSFLPVEVQAVVVYQLDATIECLKACKKAVTDYGKGYGLAKLHQDFTDAYGQAVKNGDRALSMMHDLHEFKYPGFRDAKKEKKEKEKGDI